MKAARFYDRGDIRIDEVLEPEPGDGQVLVDVRNSYPLKGSDLHEYLIGPVALPTPQHPVPGSGVHIPVTLGHELCGRVRNPPYGSAFRHGDQVMIDPRVLCKSCSPCTTGSSHCCSRLGYVGGTTGFGGYGEVVAIAEDKLHPLPPEIPLEFAAVLEPLAVVQHAIKVSQITDWKNKEVLVLGGGPIGFALLLCLNAAGAERVVVSEPAAARREQVAEFARAVIDPVKQNVGERCRALADGRGMEVVFDCAGVPKATEAALDAMRFESLYVMVAVWEGPMTLPCWAFLAKHITMKGTLIFDDSSMQEVMQLIVDGKLEGWQKMVTGRIGLNSIVDAGFKELINNKDKHIKILVSPKS